MTQTTTPTTGDTTTDAAQRSGANTPTVTESLDRLSLEQALIDVEVANARVIDLTARLSESHLEAQQLRQQTLELTAAAATAVPAVPASGGLRALVAGPIKAVARRVLPLSVRIRIRTALG